MAALLAASAFFSGSETALFSLDPVQVRRLRSKGAAARHLAALLSTPSKLLSTILIGNTLVNVVLASVSYSFFRKIPMGPIGAAPAALAATTCLVLIFGEISPKRIAVRRPLEIASAVSGPLWLFHRLSTPLRLLLGFIASKASDWLKPERVSPTDEELLTAIELSNEGGALDAYERRFASGIMRLSSMTASDVMTPRVDFSGIDLDEPEESYPALIRSTPFRNLPVYENSPDSISGFLDVRAYLLDPGHDFDAALRKPVFVPETATLDDILVTMQGSRRHIVCVIDEYGGVAGLLTRGDILEVMAGPLPEAAEEPPHDPIAKIGDTTWRIDGDASLELVNMTLGTQLEAEGADRISGWVVEQAGHFVRTGETVEAQGCVARVSRTRKLRILTVELEIASAEEDAPDGGSGAQDAAQSAGAEGGVA